MLLFKFMLNRGKIMSLTVLVSDAKLFTRVGLKTNGFSDKNAVIVTSKIPPQFFHDLSKNVYVYIQGRP